MRVHFVLHETFEVPGAYLKGAGAWSSGDDVQGLRARSST